MSSTRALKTKSSFPVPPVSAPPLRARPATAISAAREAVKARGYWELVWIRFRRDKVAIASAIFIVLLILVAFVGAPLAKQYVGHGPNDIFAAVPQVVELPSLLPAGPMTHFANPVHRGP